MGSFSIACCVSQQTIAERDKCRIIAIKQSASYRKATLILPDGQEVERYDANETACNPDSFWEPVSTFFEAEYADYGRVNLAMTDTTRSSLLRFYGAVLSKSPQVKASDDGRYPAFELANFIREHTPLLVGELLEKDTTPRPNSAQRDKQLFAVWKYIWNAMECGRLFMLNLDQEPRPLKFAVIHEDVYQMLVQRSSSGTNRNGDSREPVAYLTRALADARAKSAERLEFIRNRRKEKGQEDRPNQSELDALSQSFFMADRMREHFCRITSVSAYPLTDVDAVTELVLQLNEGKLTEEQCLANLAPLLPPLYAVAAMENLNTRFHPIVPADQDYSNAIGKAYVEFVKEAGKRVNRSRNVSKYGEFFSYELYCTNQACLDKLLDEHLGWDMAIEVDRVDEIRYHRDDAPTVRVHLQATADMEYLCRLLAEVGDPLMRNTVRNLDV